MKKFIDGLPKAELHLHIEGTLEPELLFKLAERNKISLPYRSVMDAHKAYQFTDLQSFLDIYYAGAKVLIHEEDFFDLTFEYLKRAKEQNIRHAEIFFDPQTHTHRGIAFDTVINGISSALQEGKKQFNISSKIIMCFLRDLSEADAIDTLKMAMPYREHIVGIGLDSAEVNNPPSKFTEVFKEARQKGFLAVAHAGEEGHPDYIWEALDLLKAKRIDHGVRCLEDQTLIQRLIKEQTPLTVCPISNIKLCVYQDMKEHPIKKMLELGLCVCINSDDPAYFRGYINENILAIHHALGLTKDQLYQLALNSFNSSFLNREEKKVLIQELDQYKS